MIKSTIGKKIIVALTGVILFGFVAGHMAGNLLVFAGPDVFNRYAVTLKANLLLLWGTRGILLGSVLLHVIFTLLLTRQNRASRPVGYELYKPQDSTLSSRVMIWSGLLLGVYIVYHLLHFTLGSAHPRFDSHDIYSNVIIGFNSLPVSLLYIAAMIALGFHLHHGIWSVFQTLGLNHPKYNGARRIFATTASILIVGGFVSIPLAVLMGGLR